MKMALRATCRKMLRLALILVCGIVIGFLLLIAVYALPVDPIAENVKLSVQSMDGSWATGEIAYEQLVKGYVTTQLDNSTDANMLLVAAHESDAPLMQQVIDSATYMLGGRCYPALLAYGQTGTETLTSVPIARYWHGYLLFLKPLLSCLSYMDIRMLQMVVQLMLLGAAVVGFCRRGLTRYTPAFLLALVCITPAITGFSLQFSVIYTVFLVAMILLLYAPRLARTRFSRVAFFLLVGMATSYFDYLTYPIASFGMPFITLLLLHPAKSRGKAVWELVVCLGAWLAGYFGMWAGKWALAALLGQDQWFIPNLIAKISQRSSHVAKSESIGYFALLGSILNVFKKRAYLFVAGLAAVGYGLWLWLSQRKVRKSPTRTSSTFRTSRVALLLSALLPLIWYAFTANHTYSHLFFTSRAMTVIVFAVLSFVTTFLPSQEKR
ncbi:MAG: hypothetical protein PHY64_01945 [Eubacteriales bacterium]|nr:hypothetical protein [Eubacteriales bacterium]